MTNTALGRLQQTRKREYDVVVVTINTEEGDALPRKLGKLEVDGQL